MDAQNKTNDTKFTTNFSDSSSGLIVQGIGKSFDKRPVVRDVSLRVSRGESVGILGPNGAGKTTCFYMITGQIPADRGRILLDGEDVTDLPMYRRARLGIGYLPQENFIINDTLVTNITLNYKKEEIDKKKIQDILNSLELNNFVNTLPQNIDTLIGENGVKLSGGQRQKVCLARLLYYNKEILILDEATNALDKVSEMNVIKLLRSLKNKTIIMISHDFENLKFCNKLYKLSNGKVQQIGNSNEI